MQIGTASLLSSTLGRAMTDLRASFDDLTRADPGLSAYIVK